jgi:uncharacterized membrane protein YphA (DoxX/SURF4 family)
MTFRKLGYWLATALVAFGFAASGVMNLMHAPAVVAGAAHLGYPAYLATILGIWMPLAAVALVVPGFARIKEWAYAGIVFHLTGAAFSHAAAGDPFTGALPALVLLALAVASYLLRPASRRLAAEQPAAEAQRLATA